MGSWWVLVTSGAGTVACWRPPSTSTSWNPIWRFSPRAQTSCTWVTWTQGPSWRLGDKETHRHLVYNSGCCKWLWVHCSSFLSLSCFGYKISIMWSLLTVSRDNILEPDPWHIVGAQNALVSILLWQKPWNLETCLIIIMNIGLVISK